MLAYRVDWNLRRRFAPRLVMDDDWEAARAKRTSPVQTAEVSDRARDKAADKITPNRFPVHSLPTLLADFVTLILNVVALPGPPTSHSRFPLGRRHAKPKCSDDLTSGRAIHFQSRDRATRRDHPIPSKNRAKHPLTSQLEGKLLYFR